jgi:toxin FitB
MQHTRSDSSSSASRRCREADQRLAAFAVERAHGQHREVDVSIEPSVAEWERAEHDRQSTGASGARSRVSSTCARRASHHGRRPADRARPSPGAAHGPGVTKGFLLDTNVISETMRPRPDPRVLEWVEQRDDDEYLSVVTVGEIEAGIRQALARAPDDDESLALRRWLDDALIPRFGSRLLEVDLAGARTWGALTAHARTSGTVVEAVHTLLAAAAITHGLTLATRNTRDFRHVPVSLLDPWTP